MYASGASFRACVIACVSATNLLALLVQILTQTSSSFRACVEACVSATSLRQYLYFCSSKASKVPVSLKLAHAVARRV